MKKTLLKGVSTRLAGGMAIALMALGVFGSAQAATGIANTKHNLTSGVLAGANTFTPGTGSGEICVFCHTPHGADTAVLPLWNRVSSGATYQTYSSLGTASLDGATASVGSVSLACLSCHDGTQAMNTMINQPGSGGYNAAGGLWAGSWAGTNVNADGTLKAGVITNIGSDLRNDHPIGIQYAGGPSGTSIPAAGTDYTAFKDPDFQPAKSASLNGKQVWWVETGAAASGRQKTDMALYARTETAYLSGTSSIASTVNQPYVECASCHDPHTENTTFLRISNSGSAVCLACHIK